MVLQQATQPSMYCRKCGYHLAGLSENRCPECGRTFDSANVATFLRDPRAWAARRRLRRILLAGAVLVLLVLLVPIGARGYVRLKHMAEWQAEQQALAALQQAPSPETHGSSMLESLGVKPIIRLASPLPDRFTAPVNYMRDRVQYVNADGKRLSATTAAQLAAFGQMRELGLMHTGIGDDDLKALQGMTRLTYLRLGGNPGITDEGLEHLRNLSELKMLILSGTGISGQGLAQLSGLAKLDSLGLSRTGIADMDLPRLACFPLLSSLHLAGTAVTDAGLGHLKALQLQVLDLADTRISDAGLAQLKEVPLTFLNLSGTGVTDAGLAHLRTLPLTHVMLMRTQIADAGLAEVGQITALVDLDLRDTKVTDAGLQHLVGLKNLRTLCVKRTAVTAEGGGQLREALPRLEIQQ